MKKYKVLTKDLISPYKGFQYELGKQYVCKDFDISKAECSNGFYAVDLEGLTYCLNKRKDNRVFEVSVTGKSKKFGIYKQRFEKQKIIREVPIKELKKLVKEYKCGYDLYHALFPKNPLIGKPKKVTEREINLLAKVDSVWGSVWGSVRASVRGSVGNSIRASVWASVSASVGNSVGNSIRASVWASVSASVSASVWDSVWDSVGNSVGNSVGAYIGSLFKIDKWKYIEHKEGVYPFECYIDLWNSGFVPSFDGETWRLHSGKNAEIVYEIKKEDIAKWKVKK